MSHPEAKEDEKTLHRILTLLRLGACSYEVVDDRGQGGGIDPTLRFELKLKPPAFLCLEPDIQNVRAQSVKVARQRLAQRMCARLASQEHLLSFPINPWDLDQAKDTVRALDCPAEYGAAWLYQRADGPESCGIISFLQAGEYLENRQVVAVDCEWNQEEELTLMQLACDFGVLLFQPARGLAVLPIGLQELFDARDTTKVGLGVHNDVRVLRA